MQYFQEKEKPPNPLMIEGAGGVDAPKALFYLEILLPMIHMELSGQCSDVAFKRSH